MTDYCLALCIIVLKIRRAGLDGGFLCGTFTLLDTASREERYDKQQHDGAYERGDERAKGVEGDPAHHTHQPASQYATYDADDEVEYKACATAAYNKVGKPAGHQADEEIP